MNKLPNNWVFCKLSDVCSKPQYGWTSKAIKEGKVKYLRTTDISSGKIQWDKVPYCANIPEGLEKYQLKKNDILISRTGSVGISCRIDKDLDFPVIFASYLIRFRAYDEIVSEFLEIFFNSQFYWRQIVQITSGIAVPNINATNIEQIRLPFPPLEIQKALVEKVLLLQGKAKRINDNLKLAVDQLQKMRKSIIVSGLNGDLTNNWRIENKKVTTTTRFAHKNSKEFIIDNSVKEIHKIPSSWKWVALGNYAKCSRGRFSIRPRNDPRFFNGDYPFIQIGDLPKEGGFINKHVQTLNENGIKVSKLFKKGTVVVAIVGSTIGNTGILAYDMYFTDSLVGIQAENDISNIFLEFYLRSDKEKVRKSSYSGGGQPNIKLQTLNNYPLPLPPLEEQITIVNKINELLKSSDSLEKHYLKLLDFVNEKSSEIYDKAFSGKLSLETQIGQPVKELLKKFKTMKKNEVAKKTKPKILKIESAKEENILAIIKNAFKLKPFTFQELQAKALVNYDDLSQGLIDLVYPESPNNSLTMLFDKMKNRILFKVNKYETTHTTIE